MYFTGPQVILNINKLYFGKKESIFLDSYYIWKWLLWDRIDCVQTKTSFGFLLTSGLNIFLYVYRLPLLTDVWQMCSSRSCVSHWWFSGAAALVSGRNEYKRKKEINKLYTWRGRAVLSWICPRSLLVLGQLQSMHLTITFPWKI